MANKRNLRRQGRRQAKGYGESGASTTRRALKGFVPSSGSPYEDIDWNNFTLRQRGRMLYMASPVATSAINTNRTKVVGTGLTLKSAIDRDVLGLSADAAQEWQRKTEAEFRLWASKKENCDAIGVNNFAGLQQLALKSWLMSGDVFALVKRYDPTPTNPYSFRIHLIEADRVSTPDTYRTGLFPGLTEGKNTDTGSRIHDGVEVDGNGMIVAYHIRNTHPGQVTAEKTEWTRVEAYGGKTGMPNILQVMDSERADQYRGVTYLAQVVEPLLQLRRYTESELMAALIQSFFSAWIITDTDKSEIPINEVGAGSVAGVPGAAPEGAAPEGAAPEGAAPEDGVSDDPNEYEMGPGIVTHLGEGESIEFGSPNIPTAGFERFVKTLLMLVGAALELPYDVLAKEYNSSYSSARAALLDAWEAFKMRRAWFVDDFTQPIYEIWLAEAIALGRIKAPGYFADPLLRAAWGGSRWIGPVQGQIDPAKEVKAAIMSVDRAFKTHEQVTRELGGGDWDDNVEQLMAENIKLAEAGGGRYMAVLDDSEGDDDGNPRQGGLDGGGD